MRQTSGFNEYYVIKVADKAFAFGQYASKHLGYGEAFDDNLVVIGGSAPYANAEWPGMLKKMTDIVSFGQTIEEAKKKAIAKGVELKDIPPPPEKKKRKPRAKKNANPS